MSSTSNENRDLKNQAYNMIKSKIVNCIYAPCSILNETMLATELGFSRTPIREAISRLETEGLVRILPKKGIYVSDISLNDVHQIFNTRIEIEPLAVKLAGNYLPESELLAFREKFIAPAPVDIKNSFRLDTAMHLFIIEHCGNRYLIDMMKRVFEDNTRVIIASKQNHYQIHDARQEHLEILDALLDHEIEQATALMRTHVEQCRKAALDYFYSMQAYSEIPSSTYKSMLKEFEK